MCLLCYIAPNSPVNWQGLEYASINNPDGFGWAIHHGDYIQVGRYMDATDALDSFYYARRAAEDKPAMYHARWATHGTEDVDNVHPFYVDLNDPHQGETVLAHNGILPVSLPKGDPRSDTRYFAEELMKLRANFLLDKPHKVAKLEKWMGGSKFVVFTTDPGYNHDVYIVNEGLGHWDSTGTWWSNDSYQYKWFPRSYGSGYGSYSWERDFSIAGAKAIESKVSAAEDAVGVWQNDDREEITLHECPVCGIWLPDESWYVEGVCDHCWSCLECFDSAANCLCYDPDKKYRDALAVKGYDPKTGREFYAPGSGGWNPLDGPPADSEGEVSVKVTETEWLGLAPGLFISPTTGEVKSVGDATLTASDWELISAYYELDEYATPLPLHVPVGTSIYDEAEPQPLAGWLPHDGGEHRLVLAGTEV